MIIAVERQEYDIAQEMDMRDDGGFWVDGAKVLFACNEQRLKNELRAVAERFKHDPNYPNKCTYRVFDTKEGKDYTLTMHVEHVVDVAFDSE